jgi:hypothetical protein
LWLNPHQFTFGTPNEDGSNTINLYMPLKGPDSFETIKSNQDFANIVKKNSKSLASLIPNLDTLWETLKISYL